MTISFRECTAARGWIHSAPERITASAVRDVDARDDNGDAGTGHQRCVSDDVQRFRAALAGDERCMISLRPQAESVSDFARALAHGLRVPWRRRIPSRFLYDSAGSRLFEKICDLPEYYPTRTETSILARSAALLCERTGPVNLVELGAGSSQKAALLLAAAREIGDVYDNGSAPHYVAIDVCETALRQGQEDLAHRLPGVISVGLHARFEQALPLLRAASPVMVLFLGSSIGNCSRFEAADLLRTLYRELSPGDFVLLGLDFVKDVRLLHAAYNDEAGVTAAFTRNLFVRMNRELGAGVAPEAIDHQAVWVAERQRIEIHAHFRSRQVIRVAPLELCFTIEEGERILTEISRKYTLSELPRWFGAFGFCVQEILRDERDWFAVVLLRKPTEPA